MGKKIKRKVQRWGTGVGVGPGGNTGQFPPIQPIVESGLDRLKQAGMKKNALFFRMGKMTIIVGKSKFGWHLSMAHPERYPTWDEVAHVRYEMMPENIHVAMILPPKDEYINIHNYCFQLHQVVDDPTGGYVLGNGAQIGRQYDLRNTENGSNTEL